MSKVWAQLAQLPKPEQRVIEASGLMNRDWYLWHMRVDALLRELQAIEIGDLANVDFTVAATDGQALVYVDADSAWKPTTIEFALGDLTDVDLTTPATDTQQLTYVDADSVWKAGAA